MAVWLGALALAALGVLYVVHGARRRGANEQRRQDSQAVFADRAREIQAEGLAQGLPAEQVAALEQELALELLAGDEVDAKPPATRGPARQTLAFLLGATAFGVVALGLYAWWGDPQAPEILSAFDALVEDDSEEARALASALTIRAARRPEDVNTWLHLAGLRMRLADYDGAAAAFASAHRLVGTDEQVDLAWAQARFLADGGTVSATTREIAGRVLAKTPNHPAMLELLAMGDLRAGEYASAARHLAGLLRQEMPAERRRLLANTLALARERQGGDRAFVSVAVTVEGVSAGADAPWLMVFLRPESGGPPLAVARQPAQAQQTVVLDDANTMVVGSSLASSGSVRAVARLSSDGSAADFQAEAVSEPVDPAAGPHVDLTLRATETKAPRGG